MVPADAGTRARCPWVDRVMPGTRRGGSFPRGGLMRRGAIDRMPAYVRNGLGKLGSDSGIAKARRRTSVARVVAAAGIRQVPRDATMSITVVAPGEVAMVPHPTRPPCGLDRRTGEQPWPTRGRPSTRPSGWRDAFAPRLGRHHRHITDPGGRPGRARAGRAPLHARRRSSPMPSVPGSGRGPNSNSGEPSGCRGARGRRPVSEGAAPSHRLD